MKPEKEELPVPKSWSADGFAFRHVECYFFFPPKATLSSDRAFTVESIRFRNASRIAWREVSNGLSLGRRRCLPFSTATIKHRTRSWIGLDMRFDFAIVMCLDKGRLNYTSILLLPGCDYTPALIDFITHISNEDMEMIRCIFFGLIIGLVRFLPLR